MSNIQSVLKRDDKKEILAKYGAGNYVLAPEFKKFQVLSHTWHSWGEERKNDDIKKFQGV